MPSLGTVILPRLSDSRVKAAYNIARILLTFIFILTLSACALAQPLLKTPSAGESRQQPTTGTAAPAQPGTPPAGAVAPQASGATPAILGTPASNPTEKAIQAVILSGNKEQMTAVANGDPTVMQDTSTSTYYTQLVQGNSDMTKAGAKSIKLTAIEWGPIIVQGDTGAQATTYESWQTTYTNDQTELQVHDLNVYTLVLDKGVWKIQADAHPNDQLTPVSGNGPTRRRPTPTPATGPAPTIAISTSDQSHNWSGYAATGGTFTSVTGSWLVPEVNAPLTAATANAGDATWVGIGGVNSKDLIQSGTEAQVVGPGDTVYDAWIELLPASSQTVPLVVDPGDSITVTITQTQNGTWSIVLKNNTTGQNYQTNVQYHSSTSSAEWVEEAPSGGRRVEPLDNFGTTQFTAASTMKNGKTATIATAGGQSIAMTASNGQPLAAPSKLGSDGSSFSVVRQ